MYTEQVVAEIHCDTFGCPNKVHVVDESSQAIQQTLHTKGWRVDIGERKHLCPVCAHELGHRNSKHTLM